jgi:CPA1 family monovalent cation:H+ antiporter
VAIALGAIVAPPDASAATAVLRQLRPPHRLIVILEGESLLNDATALLIYRVAVAAAMTGAAVGWGVVPTVLWVTVGSVALGALLSRLMLIATAGIEDVATAVIVQFLGTFAVWLIAERLHLSGIVTMVTFAILVARTAPDLIPARVRIPSYAVWEVAVFVLNVLAFILVGLQLKPILARLDRSGLITYAQIAAAVLATVVLVRIVWVLATQRPRPSRESLVVAWCGMRGTVTLAAALALPDGPRPFPYRDLVLFTSFWVVLGTLVLQGMTLPALIDRLRLADDGTVGDEVRLARVATARAAIDALDGHNPAVGDTLLLRRKYELRLTQADGRGAMGGNAAGEQIAGLADAVHAAQRAERRRLSELRAEGTIGDDAFHRLEEELDWAELGTEGMLRAP